MSRRFVPGSLPTGSSRAVRARGRRDLRTPSPFGIADGVIGLPDRGLNHQSALSRLVVSSGWSN